MESRRPLRREGRKRRGEKGEGGKRYSLFAASLTVDQRERASCLNLIALESDATLFDLEAAAGMAACAISFRRFARGESMSTAPAPEILSSSLFIQREFQSWRGRSSPQTSFAGQVSSDRASAERQTWENISSSGQRLDDFPTGRRAKVIRRVRRAQGTNIEY